METGPNSERAAQGGQSVNRNAAMKFVVLLGFVSFFADMTYEGARSVTGPFLATLGASGAIVGLVAGLGEFIGYGLRIVSGYISDKTGQYWIITEIGYCLNLLAVPMLALAGNWQLAAALLILERTGKAIRNPARDAMLSHATSQIGHGWGFALHEAMDQIGAVMGPLLVALAIGTCDQYRAAFRILLIPALLALGVLGMARILYPKPRSLEVKTTVIQSKGLPRKFWIYILAIALVAAGYADFPLIAFHLKKAASMPDTWVPLLYAGTMGIDAVAALVFGKLYDKVKVKSLIAAVGLSAFFAPLAFLGSIKAAMVGIALWGIGMGAQESILRAAVAEMVVPERRGSAYGIFNAGYGFFWFVGSALMGIFYDISIPVLVGFSVLTQLCSVAVLVAVSGNSREYPGIDTIR
ncbi:MAG TPA: MFS transporter [Firmicutes bacterium]|nr:MFS transporter [Candidatus Fermentithermobacillaceae bacterium]